MSSEQLKAILAERIEPKPIPPPTSVSEIPAFIIAVFSFSVAASLGAALPLTSQYLPEVIVVRVITGFISFGAAAMLVTASFFRFWGWSLAWRAAAVLIPLFFLSWFSVTRKIMHVPNRNPVFAHTSMFPELLATVVACITIMGIITWVRPSFAGSPSHAPTIGFEHSRYGLIPLTAVLAVTLLSAAMLTIWVWGSESKATLELLTRFVYAPASGLLFLAGFLGAASRFRQYPLAIVGAVLFATLSAIALSMSLNWSNPFLMKTWIAVGIPFDLIVTLPGSLLLGLLIPAARSPNRAPSQISNPPFASP